MNPLEATKKIFKNNMEIIKKDTDLKFKIEINNLQIEIIISEEVPHKIKDIIFDRNNPYSEKIDKLLNEEIQNLDKTFFIYQIVYLYKKILEKIETDLRYAEYKINIQTVTEEEFYEWVNQNKKSEQKKKEGITGKMFFMDLMKR